MYMCECGQAHAVVYLWRSEDYICCEAFVGLSPPEDSWSPLHMADLLTHGLLGILLFPHVTTGMLWLQVCATGMYYYDLLHVGSSLHTYSANT